MRYPQLAADYLSPMIALETHQSQLLLKLKEPQSSESWGLPERGVIGPYCYRHGVSFLPIGKGRRTRPSTDRQREV